MTSTSEASTASASSLQTTLEAPADTLARHSAVEYVGKLETVRLGFDENARHGTAHGAETEERNAQRLRGAALRTADASNDDAVLCTSGTGLSLD